MTRSRCGLRPLAAGRWWCVLAVAAVPAYADESVAPYVPTVEEDVERMLEIGGVGPGDYLIDLGSGDGRIVIAAARRGAMGHGVELDPELVRDAARNATAAGVDDRVAFVQGDVFAAEISAATVVTLYLFPEANIALRPKLLAELAPGTRVVSNSFDMGDWRADEHDTTARSSGGILLWIVPARVDGDWDLEIDGDGRHHSITVEQRYQDIQLRSVGADAQLELAAATLRGDKIAFTGQAGDARYLFSGRVDGAAMTGFVQVEQGGGIQVRTWRARRAIGLPPPRRTAITPPAAATGVPQPRTAG